MDIALFSVGQTHVAEVAVTPERVRAFAEATGDFNPIHFDEAFAATTRFQRPIAHGALLTGLLSGILGTQFPGPGTIYVSQTMKFLRPVAVGATVRIRLAVTGLQLEKRRLILDTVVEGADGQPAATGEAQVYLPP